MTPNEEREYSVRLGICLALLRKINKARRQGKFYQASVFLKALHQVEGRNG